MGSIDSEAMRARGIIVLVHCNFQGVIITPLVGLI